MDLMWCSCTEPAFRCEKVARHFREVILDVRDEEPPLPAHEFANATFPFVGRLQLKIRVRAQLRTERCHREHPDGLYPRMMILGMIR